MSYRPFSKDLWEYLGDMPYMPSRAGRDELAAGGDLKRLNLWDYFFRIRPEDVGKPQQLEIRRTRLDLDVELQEHQEHVKNIKGDILHIQRQIGKRLRGKLVPGVSLLIIGTGLAIYMFNNQGLANYMLYCSAPLWLVGGGFLLAALSTWRSSKREMAWLDTQIESLSELNRRKIKAARNRIAGLEVEIEYLKRQIPQPPMDSQVRAWLNDDLSALHKRCIELTGLGDRLAPVETPDSEDLAALTINPIPVMGPGELQDSKHIPRSFRRDENSDLNKHLTARRAYPFIDEVGVDVLYGVYYIKYIAVAEDMMATYGFFYDFINGKQYAERETEQYYRDVVSIATTKESRQVMLGVDSDEYILVEDAPTFTLSLPSSEIRTVTFVNQNYFQGIRDKLERQARTN